MMSKFIRDLFHAKKTQRQDSETIKVLVVLTEPPDDANLAELQDIGLKVQTVAGDKLVGEIESQLLPSLLKHDSVDEIERSATLQPCDNQN